MSVGVSLCARMIYVAFFVATRRRAPPQLWGWCVELSVLLVVFFFLPLGVESGGVGVDEMQQTMFKAQTS